MLAGKIKSLLLLMLMMGLSAAGQTIHQPISGYTPQRVYDSAGHRFSDFEAMLADLSRADVVFVGEQHDDSATHRLEGAILEGLARRRGNIVVAMEMFERDVQKSLDDYFSGRLSEEEFLKVSRPWPRYEADYRPIVELARSYGWRLIASNVPRRYATQVSKQGLAAIESVPAAERGFIASQIECPIDDYYKRFSQTMSSHPGAHSSEAEKKPDDARRATIERFYFAQCLKDETMAESIANQMESKENKPLVIHFNGAFHSDYHLGAASRANRRLPKSKIKVLTVVPLEDLDAINVDEYSRRGDYVVFTIKKRA